jgi:hypothetical protein
MTWRSITLKVSQCYQLAFCQLAALCPIANCCANHSEVTNIDVRLAFETRFGRSENRDNAQLTLQICVINAIDVVSVSTSWSRDVFLESRSRLGLVVEGLVYIPDKCKPSASVFNSVKGRCYYDEQ